MQASADGNSSSTTHRQSATSARNTSSAEPFSDLNAERSVAHCRLISAISPSPRNTRSGARPSKLYRPRTAPPSTDSSRKSPRSGSISFSAAERSEEHKSELQSLMRISYAVFYLKKQQTHQTP